MRRGGRRQLVERACLAAGVAAVAVLIPHDVAAGELVLDVGDGWRAASGDDLTWRTSAYDDGEWMLVDLPETAGEGPAAGGMAWYRRTVELDPERVRAWERVDLALGVGMGLGTSYEVYADGVLLGTHGQIPPSPSSGPGVAATFEIPRELYADGRLLLALRTWQYPHAARWAPAGTRWLSAPFVLGASEAVAASVEVHREKQHNKVVAHLVAGFFLLLIGVFHLLVWRGRAEVAAFGWYGVVVTVIAVSKLLYVRGEPIWPHYSLEMSARLEPWIGAVLAIAAWELVFSFFAVGRPRWWWVYWLLVASSAGVTAGGFVTAGKLAGNVLLGVSAVGIAAIVAWRAWRGSRAARIVGAGILVLLAGAVVSLLATLNVLPNELYWASTEMPLGITALAQFVFIGTMAYALADRFQRQMEGLEKAHAASRRFVPADFLRLLGRNEVVQVERGDVAQREMTVMFADVRGFTTRAEQQTPKESLAWINRYLATVEPSIRDHGGFVNQYYGDGIMALFDSADEALDAALAMQRAVTRTEGLGPDLRIGIGLHTGLLVLGTVGGAERLDTGVVGDAVNTAARIESLTKEYDRAVLLSGETRAQLMRDHALTEIDRVALRGKSSTITLYSPT